MRNKVGHTYLRSKNSNATVRVCDRTTQKVPVGVTDRTHMKRQIEKLFAHYIKIITFVLI